jgi:hypothetical protein
MRRNETTTVVWPIATGILSAVIFCCQAVGAEPDSAGPTASAERLVQQAGRAEIDGDMSHSFALLREAVRLAPTHPLARWQLGQLQIDDEWIAVEEVQRRAAADPKQARYRELRTEHGESPAGQFALARWCRKNNLDDEARFHWASVLSVDPGNEEALRALDLRWQNGQLLTRQQIGRQTERRREMSRLEKQWSSTIAKWRRAVTSDDSTAREQALEEIRAISTVDVISALEQVTLASDVEDKKTVEERREISLAFLTALEKLREHASTESLVRHAVLATNSAVRSSAIEKLKDRPPHDYVPILLSGLAMPVESSFSVHTAADGSIHYRHALYREGQNADWSVDANYNTAQHVLPGKNYQYRIRAKVWEDRTPYAARVAQIAAVARRDWGRYARTAAVTEARVHNANQTAATLNSRIVPVLAATTGQNFTTAKQWWDWWQDSNEYYEYEHPVEQQYVSNRNNYYYGQLYDTVTYNMSCFCRGTPVWSKTGQRPIESLEIGDLVLAQDVDTGELAFKPIIGRTVRPPSEILDVKVGDEMVRTTRGHPFWVSGIGWRMAKELGDGAILHGVTGAARVEAVESSGEEEAYNLVVADFNTYFVGESGLLVHDNMPRRPTRASVPGIVAQKKL